MQVKAAGKQGVGRVGPEDRPGKPAQVACHAAEYGYHSGLENDSSKIKWVQVDLGKSQPIEQIVMTGCYDDFNYIGAGFGFPVRFKVEIADDAGFRSDVQVVLDRMSRDMPNPGTAAQTIPVSGLAAASATKLAPRQNDYIFALAELSVLDKAGNNVARHRPVTALDSIEALPRWAKKNLVDGIANMSAPAATDDLGRLKQERQDLLKDCRPELQEERAANERCWRRSARSWPGCPPRRGGLHLRRRAAVPSSARGRWRQAEEAIHILARGDVKKPGKEVGPGLAALAELPARFDLPEVTPKGNAGRLAAAWLTDAKIRSRGAPSSIASGCIISTGPWWIRPTISAAWGRCPPIRNCSNGWRSNSAMEVSPSRSCIELRSTSADVSAKLCGPA